MKAKGNAKWKIEITLVVLIDHNVHSVQAATEIVRVQTLHVLLKILDLAHAQGHLQEILIRVAQTLIVHVALAKMVNVHHVRHAMVNSVHVVHAKMANEVNVHAPHAMENLNHVVHAKMVREVSEVIDHVATTIVLAMIGMIVMIVLVVLAKMVNVQAFEIAALLSLKMNDSAIVR